METGTERCSLKTAVPKLLKVSDGGKELFALWRGISKKEWGDQKLF